MSAKAHAKAHRPQLGAALYAVLTVALPMPLVWALHTELTDTTEHLVTYDLGVVAYVWWLEAIVLGSRPRWAERLLPLPVLYLSHMLLATLALIAAWVHRQVGFSFHREVRLSGDVAWWIALGSFAWGLLMLSGVLVDRFRPAAQLKKAVEKGVSHRVSLWIHRLQWVMVVAIVLHIQFIPRLAMSWLFNGMALAYFAVTVLTAGYSMVRRRWMPHLRGRVTELKLLAPKTWLLKINVPQSSVPAGASYMLRFQGVEGLSREPHPFSLVSPGGSVEELSFLIAASGDFTSALGKVQPEATVYLEGPLGALEETVRAIPQEKPLVYIGLGTGVGPIRSLVGSKAHAGENHVLWVVRNEPYLQEEFNQELARGAIDSFKVQVGRPSRDDLQRILGDRLLSESTLLIIGPPAAIIGLRRNLQALGVDSSRLLDERLTM